MATEIRVPTLGESVSEATVGTWFKKVGDTVKADEPLVELETDKVTVEVPAPASGVLTEIVAQNGETVGLDALLGQIAEGAAGAATAAPAAKPAAAAAPAPAATAAAPAAGGMPPAAGAAAVAVSPLSPRAFRRLPPRRLRLLLLPVRFPPSRIRFAKSA